VWGPGIDNLLAIVVPGGPGATPAVFCALTDHLGTVHALADETGAVVESYCYDAWGRVLGVYDGSGQPLDNSAIGNRYLFQGREYSWATGLYYFRARGYDPMTGRWLSSDPIGISGGLNQYAFCDGDPLGQADPLGLRVIIYPPSLDGFSPANQAAAMQLHAQLKAGWNRMLNGGGTPTLTSIARALHQTPDVTIHVRVCELGYQGEVLPDGYPPDICMLVGLGGMEPIETFVHEMVHVIELMADRTPRSPLLGNAGVQRVLDALRKMSEDGSVRFGFSDTVGGGVPVKGGRLADTLAGALLGQMEAE
jgi:RHS repeat-associated protein